MPNCVMGLLSVTSVLSPEHSQVSSPSNGDDAGLSLLHQYVALCHVGLLAVLLHISARRTINFLALSAACVMNRML